MSNESTTPAAQRFTTAATDLARELIKDECTGIDHYIRFDNGEVWVVNLFKMPASAIESISSLPFKDRILIRFSLGQVVFSCV